ncbi:MAG: PD-(D/E)XK nuclease family protein, partial [Burkholderiales bacterium]
FYAVAAQIKQILTQQPQARIGVIVLDLAARRSEIMRIFDDVLEPGCVLAVSHARPFNVSLGLPLADYPLVHGALLILELARGELDSHEISSLLRSPFLFAAEQEMAPRALLDAGLRARGQNRVTLGALPRAAHGGACPQLAARLENWIPEARKTRKLKQAPSGWSGTLLALLKGLGWPGERTLDSGEYQTFEKCREQVSRLSVLDAVTPLLSFDAVLTALRRLWSDTLFQPQAPQVPVQILGVLEANALQFDRLFVTGLCDEAWPPPSRPNPLLPISLQRAVPHAGAEWQLAYAHRTTRLWLASAPEVLLTCPQHDGERELRPSPLLAGLPAAALQETPPRVFHSALFAARRSEEIMDDIAPRLQPGIEVPGGAGFFKNQAACPFRAFAIHRLGATALENAHPGLDARERGLLAHRAAENLWQEMQGSARLNAASDEELNAVVARAVSGALETLRKLRPDALTPAFAALEQTRIAALLLQLIRLEKARPPFGVMAREKSRAVTVAGITLSTRPDRVDRLADDSRVILDYKTGKKLSIHDWFELRPDEPQLPLYAVSAGDDDVAAVAFVQLHAQNVQFKGLAREKNLLPDVATLAETKDAPQQSWLKLFENWRTMLESLAREYLDGRADVAPKKYPETCKYCDQGTFCRVKEIKDRGPVTPEENNDE